MNIFERTVARPLGRAHRRSLSLAYREQGFPLGVAPQREHGHFTHNREAPSPTNQARCHPAHQAMQLLLRQTATSVGE